MAEPILGCKFFRALPLLLLIGFCSCLPVQAEEPVRIIVNGLEDELLENTEAMLTPPPGIVQLDGSVNQLLLERFEQQVPQLVDEALQPFGFYESRTQVSVRQVSPGIFEMIVSVEPGAPVRVTDVRVAVEGPGGREAQLDSLARRFPLQKGDILRHDIYERAKAELQNRSLDLGYLDTDFATRVIRVYRESREAEIDLVLSTGEKYFFNGINIANPPSYPERFIRRYLAFRPGDPFSFAKIGETQVNLRNSERFTDIIIVADREKADNHHIPVDISLSALPSKRLRVGAGYETDTGPRFSLRYQDLNVAERGHEFQSELDFAELVQGIGARYIVPSYRNYQSFTSFRASLRREDVDPYDAYVGMFEIERERNLGRGRTGGVFVRFLYEESEVAGERTRAYLTLPGIRYLVQRYDNFIRPRRGYRFSGEIRGTSTFLGSDQTFVQLLSDGSYLRRISTNFTLITRGQLAFTAQRESIRDLPATLRFFAGGDRSVRGYAFRSLGPENEDGDVIGGKHLAVGSVELERAIGESIGIAAFYDVGNSFNNFDEINLFQGAGIGIRYYSPVGPIKLDIARPLDRSAPVVRIHLTVGIGI
jgi:translocation and assembly module TamA